MMLLRYEVFYWTAPDSSYLKKYKTCMQACPSEIESKEEPVRCFQEVFFPEVTFYTAEL